MDVATPTLGVSDVDTEVTVDEEGTPGNNLNESKALKVGLNAPLPGESAVRDAIQKAEILQGITELMNDQMAFQRETIARFAALQQKTRSLESKVVLMSNEAEAAVKKMPQVTKMLEEKVPLRATKSGQAAAETGPDGSKKAAISPKSKQQAKGGRAGGPAKGPPAKGLRSVMRGFVQTSRFDLGMGALIVLNTAVMSAQVEYVGRLIGGAIHGHCSLLDGSTDSICPENRLADVELLFEIAEQFFSVCFFGELLLRVACFGKSYFTNTLNAMDAFVVLVSSVEAWILKPLGGSGSDRPNIALLRLVKLLRLLKVLRVVRVMKAFKALRVLVAAVAASIGAVAWSMALLFVCELIGAIFMAQVIAAYVVDEQYPQELREWMWLHFGTWWTAMLSIFEMTMAPGGFTRYRRLYAEVNFAFAFFFVTYVCLVTFAVVRVITAMFLKATLSASDSEERKTAAFKARMFEDSAKKLEAQMAAQGTHAMTEKELRQLLRIGEVKDWLQDIGVSKKDAFRLFWSLDQTAGLPRGGKAEGIKYNDFIGALLHVTGPPRALDVTTISHESVNMLARIRRIEKILGTFAPADLPEKENLENEDYSHMMPDMTPGEEDLDIDRTMESTLLEWDMNTIGGAEDEDAATMAAA